MKKDGKEKNNSGRTNYIMFSFGLPDHHQGTLQVLHTLQAAEAHFKCSTHFRLLRHTSSATHTSGC